jgi:hypothetical protein
MNDLEQIMRSGLRELADEAPAGDAVWTETEQRITAQRRSRTRKLWTGGGLALAAAIVATVAAAAALHDAPAKHRVEVNKNPKDAPNVVVTPTTSRPTPTTSAPRPAPVPGGTVLLEVVDTGIYAVDANGQRTKKLVTPFRRPTRLRGAARPRRPVDLVHRDEERPLEHLRRRGPPQPGDQQARDCHESRLGARR